MQIPASVPLSLRCLSQPDRPAWDRLTQQPGCGCFMQAWAWADFKELQGYLTFRYGIFAQETLVGGCLFYFYPRPDRANLLLAPGAPILLPGFELEGLPLLLQQATELAQEQGAIALRIEPLISEKPKDWQGFVRAPMDVMPIETLLVDLRPQPAAIFAAMKPKGRYNIRLSQRYGVETEFGTGSPLISKFYDIFWETVQRQGFLGEPYGFFINLCQTLFAANMAEIGLAHWRGEVLAAILIVYWGDRATYLYGGSRPNHPPVMASYALHWAAMQRSQSRGCLVYDFYGYTRDPDHPYAKFSQFKGQFGGTPVRTVGAHDYFFYPLLTDTLIALFKTLHPS